MQHSPQSNIRGTYQMEEKKPDTEILKLKDKYMKVGFAWIYQNQRAREEAAIRFLLSAD